MADEPRYTREEWEEIEGREWEKSRRESMERGDLRATVLLSRYEMDRNPRREQIESLLRVKCEQVRLTLLRCWDEANARG
jgi:hypothetical protein